MKKEQNDEFRRTLGSLIREARVRAGLTQEQLGLKANSTQNAVCRAEREGCGVTLAGKFISAAGYRLIGIDPQIEPISEN